MAKFKQGDHVRKKSGSEWQGYIVGWYRTKLTTEGYAIESESHAGSVQIYPANALEFVNDLESKTDAYLYFVVINALTLADIGLVVKCKNETFSDDRHTYYITCDPSVDFDAIHSCAVKEITQEEYEMFLPRNKQLYDFAARIDA